MNIKALYLNVVAVCTVELPETVGSVARVLEAGIFLEHLCNLDVFSLPSQMEVSRSMGQSRCPGFDPKPDVNLANLVPVYSSCPTSEQNIILPTPNTFSGGCWSARGDAGNGLSCLFAMCIFSSRSNRLGG